MNSTGWQLIDSIAMGYNSYTDIPPNQGQINYMVTVRSPQICSPTGTKDMSGPFSQSLSNIEDNGIIDVDVPQTKIEEFYCKIYPNPVKNELTIEYNNSGFIKYDILNVMSKSIKSSVFVNKTIADISQLPSGIYFIRLSTEKGVVLKKFIKQ
ncbi:MAG: T9SS type A sorting domain-containing protein [Bacteroidia bacterium]|nr:T9SS type A sorting domain-containing protein [Bacteroidia bacterium]